jgi:Na+/H+ antiporter NhaD/arsenite permease-like protein
MNPIALGVFAVTYLGVALGRVPGLALDRTGVALLGAIAMVALGALSPHQAAAAVDLPTLLLLYALMIFSAQFRLSGFYAWAARGLVRQVREPARFLLRLMLTSAVLSAFLANDIVCLAFAPVIAVGVARSGLSPVPFLLGLAAASNIGSAATLIGNPQNMLIGQTGHLGFAAFFLWCAPPAAAALLAAYGILWARYRAAWRGAAPVPVPETGAEPGVAAINRYQTAKGAVLLAALVVLFLTPVPRELAALSLAGVLLLSRKLHTRAILGQVDWHLLTLFCGLFIVIAGLERTGLPGLWAARLAAAGVDLGNGVVLTGVAAVLSNLVSNVPACMLLVKFLDPAQPAQWYGLAVASTFAGNLLAVGSIANLIVIEQARAHGVPIGFAEHARTGIPVTLASLAVTVLWILWMG